MNLFQDVFVERKQKKGRLKKAAFFLWDRMESNHRHKDFQSFALPTELQSQTPSFEKGLQK